MRLVFINGCRIGTQIKTVQSHKHPVSQARLKQEYREVPTMCLNMFNLQ